jgi:hypothetical protein
VRELINEFLVEQWRSSITFREYYDECKPSQCAYTIASKNGAIYIVTTVIGLVGGLVKILRLIVPRIVTLWMSFIVKKNGRIGSAINVANNRPMPNVDTD